MPRWLDYNFSLIYFQLQQTTETPFYTIIPRPPQKKGFQVAIPVYTQVYGFHLLEWVWYIRTERLLEHN